MLFSAIATASLGVVYTNYTRIPCPIPSGVNIGLFIVSGSNANWMGVTVFNHRYGIAMIEVAQSGQSYQTVTRNDNNFFVVQGGPIALPVNVRLTATETGQQVVIPITNIASQTVVSSTVQFNLGPQATPSCPYSFDTWIYTDALNSGLPGKQVAQDWREQGNWGINGAINYASTTNPHSGTKSIQVSFTNYGGFQLGPVVGIPFTQVKGISFWVRADSAFTGINFSILNLASVESSITGIGAIGTSWSQVTFNFASIAPSLSDVNIIKFQSTLAAATPNFYIDDIYFIPAASPSSTTGSPGTTTSSTISPSTCSSSGPGTTTTTTTTGSPTILTTTTPTKANNTVNNAPTRLPSIGLLLLISAFLCF